MQMQGRAVSRQLLDCQWLPLIFRSAKVPAVLFHFLYTVYSSILRTEAVDTSETSVPIYETVRLNIPKEQVFECSLCICRYLDMGCLFCSALFVPVVCNLCVVSHYPNS
jgi:hypothetical protein